MESLQAALLPDTLLVLHKYSPFNLLDPALNLRLRVQVDGGGLLPFEGLPFCHRAGGAGVSKAQSSQPYRGLHETLTFLILGTSLGMVGVPMDASIDMETFPVTLNGQKQQWTPPPPQAIAVEKLMRVGKQVEAGRLSHPLDRRSWTEEVM